MTTVKTAVCAVCGVPIHREVGTRWQQWSAANGDHWGYEPKLHDHEPRGIAK